MTPNAAHPPTSAILGTNDVPVAASGARDRRCDGMDAKMSKPPPGQHWRDALRRALAGTLASFCVAALATTSAWAASPCSPDDGGTLVCKRADRDLRIIRGTLSPSGRYGFAWGFSTGDWTDRTMDKDDRDGSYSASDWSGVENYLVRVADSEILKRLTGSHFGDRLSYNRWDYHVRWSPNSAWAIEENDTLLINVYRMEPDDRVLGPFDLKSFCQNFAVEQLVRQGKTIPADTSSFLPTINSIHDDGVIEVDVYVEGEELELKIALAAGQKRDTLDGRVISIRPAR